MKSLLFLHYKNFVCDENNYENILKDLSDKKNVFVTYIDLYHYLYCYYIISI